MIWVFTSHWVLQVCNHRYSETLDLGSRTKLRGESRDELRCTGDAHMRARSVPAVRTFPEDQLSDTSRVLFFGVLKLNHRNASSAH